MNILLYFTTAGKMIRKKLALRTRMSNYQKGRLARLVKTGQIDSRRKKQLQQLRSKNCISVIFPIETISKWKADSLLRLLLKHSRFKPAIRLFSYNESNPQANEAEQKRIREYAEALGVPCLRFESYNKLPKEHQADIIFINEPYDPFYWGIKREFGFEKRALCFIPYGFFSIGTKETMDNLTNNIAIFNFYENEASRCLAASLMKNRGSNVRITGHTMADAFLSSPDRHAPAWKDCGKPMKKVIWAPHWTITEGVVWFASSNFLTIAEQMTALAERYKDEIQFAFKPHPLLYKTLCNHRDWGKEKTDDFYRRWAEMPNTQLEEGTYVALFMQSDACIHDCSSFIIEYMFADKPALFLVKGEGYQGYSPMAQEALKCYTKGQNANDIEIFLQSVLKGEDSLYETRKTFREAFLIPPHGQSAAQNIVDCLLGEGAYADSN